MLNIQNKTKLIIGFIFLLFDYNVDVGPMNFIALPTFIGFLLIIWGISELMTQSEYFATLKKISVIMTPIFFIIYLNNMNNWLSKLLDTLLRSNPNSASFISNTTNLFMFIQYVLNIILILSVVYATYLFICGFKELATKKGGAYPSYGSQIFNTFQIYAVLKALQLIVYTLATFGTSTVAFVSDIFSMGAMIASVVLLLQANRLHNLLFPIK